MLSHPEHQFSAEDRRALLALARAVIVGALNDSPLRLGQPEPASFSLRRGVFVTLEVHGKLHGCIGVIEPRDTLRESVAHCAQSAALHDPRFPPLRPAELPGLQIEISVLSPLSPIDPKDVEIGKHGLVMATEGKRGLLLPQVATEHHFSREEFLEETCRKAGLPRDAWRDPETNVYGFTCEVFREDTSTTSP
jgi:AmmeMemoRadiSam system protein A